MDPRKSDPEYFVYDCLTVDEIEKLLNESVEKLSNILKISPSSAKVLLHEHTWNINEIVEKYKGSASNLLVSAKIKSGNKSGSQQKSCPVCMTLQPQDKFSSLNCGHSFCKNCWTMHFETQISQGKFQIRCMAPACEFLSPEDFVLNLVTKPISRNRYQQFAFQDYVKSHPELRFCPGIGCQIIVRSQDLSPKKAVCKHCGKSFCFRCGIDYHAPTDCNTIKKWNLKLADDRWVINWLQYSTKKNRSVSTKRTYFGKFVMNIFKFSILKMKNSLQVFLIWQIFQDTSF